MNLKATMIAVIVLASGQGYADDYADFEARDEIRTEISRKVMNAFLSKMNVSSGLHACELEGLAAAVRPEALEVLELGMEVFRAIADAKPETATSSYAAGLTIDQSMMLVEGVRDASLWYRLGYSEGQKLMLKHPDMNRDAFCSAITRAANAILSELKVPPMTGESPTEPD